MLDNKEEVARKRALKAVTEDLIVDELPLDFEAIDAIVTRHISQNSSAHSVTPTPDKFGSFGDDFRDVDFDAIAAAALKRATPSKRPANPYAVQQRESAKHQTR